MPTTTPKNKPRAKNIRVEATASILCDCPHCSHAHIIEKPRFSHGVACKNCYRIFVYIPDEGLLDLCGFGGF